MVPPHQGLRRLKRWENQSWNERNSGSGASTLAALWLYGILSSLLLGDRRGGKRADAAPCRLPSPAGGDPGGLLWVPQETAGSVQLSGHQGLRRHTLLSWVAPHCRQVHPTQFSRSKKSHILYFTKTIQVHLDWRCREMLNNKSSYSLPLTHLCFKLNVFLSLANCVFSLCCAHMYIEKPS